MSELERHVNVEKNVSTRSDAAFDFVATLGLCHTIVVEKDEVTGERSYKAESPDEEALVDAAKMLGFELENRSTSSMTMRTKNGKSVVYKIHAIIPFDSARKRMSVLVETPEKKYVPSKRALRPFEHPQGQPHGTNEERSDEYCCCTLRS